MIFKFFFLSLFMSYDLIGNIAILKWGEGNKKRAGKLLKENRNIKTVLEKIEKVKGRLRTYKTKYLAGVKSKEALYIENGCKFRLNVESCYFSPRLANERLEIAKKINKKDKVLVLFAGVAPFSIVASRVSKAKVVSVELGKECSRYAKINVKLNKLEDKIKVVQGDVKNLKKLVKGKFDVIVMPRPQVKESFLRYVWPFAKKGARIYYYDFGKDLEEIIEKIKNEARKARKKIKILNFKKAGEIAPYKFRWRVDLIVS